jgi:hypothetical protein
MVKALRAGDKATEETPVSGNL